jgi:hypothetical protein
MKRSITTLIVAASLMISNQCFAEEIKELFGVTLGEKLNKSSFTSFDVSSTSPYQDFHRKYYSKYSLLYAKQNKHAVFKRIEVLTNSNGIVAQITGLSDLMDYKSCREEENALSEKLKEKYKESTPNKDGNRFASWKCHSNSESDSFDARRKELYFLKYFIRDVRLMREVYGQSQEKERQRLKKIEEKYKDL